MTQSALRSRWRRLLDLALGAVDTLPDGTVWSWGGGAALAQHLQHRVCDNIDIYLTDANGLRALSPEHNTKVRALTETWQDTDNGLQLERPEGAIRFTLSPLLTAPGITGWCLTRRELPLETVQEVLAKIIRWHQPVNLAHSLYDLAGARVFDPGGFVAALETERDTARTMAETIRGDIDRLREEIQAAVRPTIKGENYVMTTNLLDLATDLAGDEGAGQVDGEDIGPLVVAHLGDGAVPCDTGVVDQKRHRGADSGNAVDDAPGIGDVDSMINQSGLGVGIFWQFAVEDMDIGAPFGQSPGDRPADPPCPSGDQCDASLKVEIILHSTASLP